MFRHTFLASIIFVLAACPQSDDVKPKQKSEEAKPEEAKEPEPDFENATQIVVEFDVDSSELYANVFMQEGFHAYAPMEKQDATFDVLHIVFVHSKHRTDYPLSFSKNGLCSGTISHNDSVVTGWSALPLFASHGHAAT